MCKVNLQVIRPWEKVVELFGVDDELAVEYAMDLLEDESQTVKTRHPFCLILWLILMNRLSQKNADPPHWFSH